MKSSPYTSKQLVEIAPQKVEPMMNPRFSENIPQMMQGYFKRGLAEKELGTRLHASALDTFGIYADVELQKLFLSACLPKGRIIVCGAGGFTQELLSYLELSCRDVDIVALVDRRAAELREVLGYEVLTAKEAVRKKGFDHAVVCNPLHEKTMIEDLREAGLPASRIIAVQTGEAYRRFSLSQLDENIESQFLKRIHQRVSRVENVILVPARDIWCIMDDAFLKEVFPPEKTIRLYFGVKGQMERSDYYPTFDTKRCLPLILRLLQRLNPEGIYLRGSAHFQTQHFAAAIKATCPESRLICEIYDYMLMFDEEILQGWQLDERSVEENRMGEVFMALHADFIVDKTPGSRWKRITSQYFKAGRIHFFPKIGNEEETAREEPPRIVSRSGDPYRLVCAGTFPEYHLLGPDGFRNCVFQNIVKPIEILSQHDDLCIDIFNSGHIATSAYLESQFKGYRSHFHPERVRYNCSIPYPELIERMFAYDFGILLFSPTDMVIDFPLQESLPNRFMGYVAGRIPIIINEEIRYAASLVSRFNAGLVVSANHMDEVPDMIRTSNSKAMREGIIALHRYMMEHNTDAVRLIKESLDAL